MKEIPPPSIPPSINAGFFAKYQFAATQSAAKYQTQVIIDAIAGSLSIQHQDLQTAAALLNKNPSKNLFPESILFWIYFTLHRFSAALSSHPFKLGLAGGSFHWKF